MKKNKKQEIYFEENKQEINAAAHMLFEEQQENIDRFPTFYSSE